MIIILIIISYFNLMEGNKKLEDIGLIVVISNIKVNTSIAEKMFETIKDYLAENNISVVLNPRIVEGQSSSFDVYLNTSTNEFNSKTISDISSKLHENNTLKNLILNNNKIEVNSIWLINDDYNYPHQFYDARQRTNIWFLCVIIVILILVVIANIINDLCIISKRRLFSISISEDFKSSKENVLYNFLFILYIQLINSYRYEKKRLMTNQNMIKHKKLKHVSFIDTLIPFNANNLPISVYATLLIQLKTLFDLNQPNDDVYQRIKENLESIGTTKLDISSPLTILKGFDNEVKYLVYKLSKTTSYEKYCTIINDSPSKLILCFDDTFWLSKNFIQFKENSNKNDLFYISEISSHEFEFDISFSHLVFQNKNTNVSKMLVHIHSKMFPLNQKGTNIVSIVLLRWLIRCFVKEQPFIILYENEDDLKKISPFIFYDFYMEIIANYIKSKPNSQQQKLIDLELAVNHLVQQMKSLLCDSIQIYLTAIFLITELENIINTKEEQIKR